MERIENFLGKIGELLNILCILVLFFIPIIGGIALGIILGNLILLKCDQTKYPKIYGTLFFLISTHIGILHTIIWSNILK